VAPGRGRDVVLRNRRPFFLAPDARLWSSTCSVRRTPLPTLVETRPSTPKPTPTAVRTSVTACSSRVGQPPRARTRPLAHRLSRRGRLARPHRYPPGPRHECQARVGRPRRALRRRPDEFAPAGSQRRRIDRRPRPCLRRDDGDPPQPLVGVPTGDERPALLVPREDTRRREGAAERDGRPTSPRRARHRATGAGDAESRLTPFPCRRRVRPTRCSWLSTTTPSSFARSRTASSRRALSATGSTATASSLYDGGHELFSSRSREEHLDALLGALEDGPAALD